MTDKTDKERLGIVETKVENHDGRIVKLEGKNAEKESAFLKAMWWCIRLLGAVTLLTVVSEKTKDNWLKFLGMFGL